MTYENASRIERLIANVLWRWLVRRGWAVRLNEEDDCHNYVERDGATYDVGWRPLFGVRYGQTPVYRGPGEVRWPPTTETADRGSYQEC